MLLQAQIPFAPKELPNDGTGKPLTVCKLVCYDHAEKNVEVISVFAAPLNLPLGDCNIKVDVRPKTGKPGVNYWFLSAQPANK